MNSRNTCKVCIVGAGVAGLAIAKQLSDKNIDFTCIDNREQIGGIWAYNSDGKFTSAWSRLNQNTPKGRYEFSDFPMPSSYPDYPTRQQVQDYLEAYAHHFKFRQKIRLNTSLEKAARHPDGGWLITTSDNETEFYDYLVVANGHHNKPNYPDYINTSDFSGDSIHSSQYRNREAYQDKNVLVVGIGNSGAQIAVDVSHSAEQTFISTRRGVYILPHYICGLRFDKLFGFVEWWWVHKILPWPVLHWISSVLYKAFLQKNKRFGLPDPDHKMFESLPTLSENFFNRIGDGRLTVKPEVESIKHSTVYFKDGTSEEIDAIIYSTGFNLDFPFLSVPNLVLKDNKVPLYKRIFSTEYPDIFFIGLFQAITFGFLHIMEHQAKLVANYIDGTYELPGYETMLHDISQEQKQIEKTFTNVLRNNYQMMGSLYVHELEGELKQGMQRASDSKSEHVTKLVNT